MIKPILEHIVKNLVDHPEKVTVEIFRDGSKALVDIRVCADDFKRVIGKEGRIIKSLRSLVSALSTDKNFEVLLDIAS